MKLFEKIRLHFFQKRLTKELLNQKRQSKTFTFWNARQIGLLFDATQEADRRDVQDFARALGKEGKKVRLLGYFHTSKAIGEQSFDHFTRKMTTWLGLPKFEKAENFINDRCDLLLVINPAGQLPVEWIAARSQAAMKIGTATENPNDFDIMLEVPRSKDVPFFLEQLDIYLDKIVLSHEPAFAKV